MSTPEEKIARLRDAIDLLDRKIVLLLNQRAENVLAVRRAKEDAGIERFDPEREGQILEKLTAVNGGPLSDADLGRVYERLLEVMRTFT